MRTLLFAFGIIVAVAAMGKHAAAQNYPWCALYSGGSMGGGQNCGFTTFEQCLATVRGIGGMCNQNTQYHPTAASAPTYRSRHKHHQW